MRVIEKKLNSDPKSKIKDIVKEKEFQLQCLVMLKNWKLTSIQSQVKTQRSALLSPQNQSRWSKSSHHSTVKDQELTLLLSTSKIKNHRSRLQTLRSQFLDKQPTSWLAKRLMSTLTLDPTLLKPFFRKPLLNRMMQLMHPHSQDHQGRGQLLNDSG